MVNAIRYFLSGAEVVAGLPRLLSRRARRWVGCQSAELQVMRLMSSSSVLWCLRLWQGLKATWKAEDIKGKQVQVLAAGRGEWESCAALGRVRNWRSVIFWHQFRRRDF